MSHLTPSAIVSDDISLAIAAAARAALAWHGKPGPAGALPLLRVAMAYAARATDGAIGGRRPTEFLALLSQPVSTWLSTDDSESLVQNDEPTEFCRDIDDESGLDPEAERVQKKIGDSRSRFATRENGGEEYVEFRRFLCQNGTCRRETAQMALIASGLNPTELYEEIPAANRLSVRGQSVFFPCPRCRWPMLISDNSVACVGRDCAADGAQFRLDGGSFLQPIGAYEPREAESVEDAVRLKRGAWRYTLLPGLVELELEARLGGLSGINVRVWPHFDRYDLHVEHTATKTTWRIDVKDWSSPGALAKRLRDRTEDEMHLVVPDRRQWQVPVLRERLAETKWQVTSVSDLVAEVRSIQGKKSGRGKV